LNLAAAENMIHGFMHKNPGIEAAVEPE